MCDDYPMQLFDLLYRDFVQIAAVFQLACKELGASAVWIICLSLVANAYQQMTAVFTNLSSGLSAIAELTETFT